MLRFHGSLRCEIPMHIVESFAFCPRCGGRSLQQREDRAVRCAQCGFLFFFNAATAVGAFIFYQGSLILSVRANEPAKGKLDLPGGFVEFDEGAEEAMRREIHEELNIGVENLQYLTSAPNDYLYAGVRYKVCDVFYTCQAPDISQIRAQDDVEAFTLIEPARLSVEDLAFPSVRTAFRRLCEQKARLNPAGGTVQP